MTDAPDGCPDCGYTQFEVATMGQRRCARCGFYSPVPARPPVHYDGPVFALPNSDKETNKRDALNPKRLLVTALITIALLVLGFALQRQRDQNREEQRSNTPKTWNEKDLGPFKRAE